MQEPTESRRQSFHTKKQKKKKKKYEAQTPWVDDNDITQEFIQRDPGHKADHYLTQKYGVSYHSAHRFLDRVFKQEVEASSEDLEKAAMLIVKNIPYFKEVGEGKYPLFDGFTAVVRNGVVITILEYQQND